MARSVWTAQPGEPGAAGRRAGLPLGGRLILALGVVVVLLALAGGGAWYLQSQASAQRVAPAVKVADLPVAGLTEAEAQAAITQHFAGLADSQVIVTYNGRPWTFTARDLGLSLDAAGTAQAAKQAGRDVRNPAADVPLVLQRDRATAEAALHTVAADIAAPAQDASFTVDADGIRVTTAQPGRQIDLNATWQALVAATQTYPFGNVTVQTVAVTPHVADADIAAALATVHRLADAPLALTGHGADGAARSWTVDPATLRTWLVVGTDANGRTTVQNKLDEAKVTAYLQALAADVQRAPQDALLALPDYATVTRLTPDVAGQQLNVAASLAPLQGAAQASGDGRTSALVLDPVPAAVPAAALQPLKTQLDATMRDGVSLTYNNQVVRVTGAQAALILYVQPASAGAAVPYQVTVSDSGLAPLVARIAANVDQPAHDATYRLVNNQPTLVRPPQDGQQVDQAATAAALKAALLAGQATAPLTVADIKPQFAAVDQAASISTPNLLKADSTYYGSSSPERNWNVTLGGSKLDGWYIAPGATFSVDDALGDLTLAAGFKMGWAIQVEAGNATTIPAEAGGICQVATTLFHPVFWAGLPFVERHHHSYWIALYGQAPMGMQGLDATISPPDSDLRFKNTTGNWLLIRAHGDHQNLRVELWGTDPGWKVSVSKPVITNVVHTDPTLRYETTDKLAAGRQVTVEHAQDGFTSDIHRVVTDQSGKVIDDWHAQGTYLPSHNTIMTGTGR